MSANLEHILDEDTVLIEESCRQPNEGAYIHALGGVILDLAPLPAPTAAEEIGRAHSVEQVAQSWKGDIQVDMRYYFEVPATYDPELHHKAFMTITLKKMADYFISK